MLYLINSAVFIYFSFMIKFDIITIFPQIFNSYLEEALISRAQKKELLKIKVHDLRNWSDDSRGKIDDRPFGGGLGMVMKTGPILKAVTEIKEENSKTKIVVFTPRGKKFNQKTVHRFSKLDQLIMVCGRYEGIDERVLEKIADEKVSIGDFVLMGGELPAMIVLESVARLVPGVIGKDNFLFEKIKKNGRIAEGMIEYPQYTRPEIFEIEKCLGKNFIKKYGNTKIKGKKITELANSKWRTPKDLISGNHKKINEWRKKREQII